MASTTLTAAGGNLFAIAAQRLGDATQWNRIAQLNGMQDPFFNGVVTLQIPPPAQSPTDGTDGILGLP